MNESKEKAHKERPWWDYSLNALELAKECVERGIKFLPPDSENPIKATFFTKMEQSVFLFPF